ncbi:ABC-type phosphate/phosphonate transport system, permease component [Megasphaera cerevisiae DSM 20462]|nr:ABC transporter permease subunit [Megasphaera cerevisiae]SJZ56047.1 ABC-type phosphate/phosphonate transport system, permease component [Megasphaera cerevisiae DSM 20462]
MNTKESQVWTGLLLLIGVSFIAATAYTGFNPIAVIPHLREGWTFFFEDFLPPPLHLKEPIIECIAVTIALAVSSTSVAAVLAAGAAVLGSERTTPFCWLAGIVRGTATFLRNIPTLVWAFILFSSLGIGTSVGFIALVITSFAFMTRTFIEVIDEIPEDPWSVWRQSGWIFGSGFFNVLSLVVLKGLFHGFSIAWK